MENLKQIGMMALSILLALVVFDMVIRPVTKGLVARKSSDKSDASKNQKS